MGNVKEKEFVKKCYGEDYIKELLKRPYNDINKNRFRNPIRITRDLGNIIQLFKLPAGSKILDMGCGSGWTTVFLSKIGYNLTGVDFSEEMIEVARIRVEQNNSSAKFLVGDFENFNSIEKFDGVLFFDCLHHAENKYKALKTAYDNLSQDGIMVFMEPNLAHKWQTGIDEYGRIEEGLYKYRWTSLLKRIGYKKIKTFYTFDRLFERKLKDRLEFLLRFIYQTTPLDVTSRVICRAEKSI